jgi:subtilisin family serine protease
VNVALIDSPRDEKHCDFYPGQIQRSITRPAANGSETGEARGECDLVLIPQPSVTVHGTHVAGIMSARVESRIGPGVYPFTTIYSYEVDLSDAKTFLPSIAALFPQMLKDKVQVLNVSGEYAKTLSGGSDPFEELILRSAGPITQKLLVVAAAGNEGQEIGADQDCPPRPACFSSKYRNVISVIAIDDNLLAPAPAVFNEKSSSNRGQHFDIAAPGLKIPSAAPMNQIAELDGTSQATPIVSGAAAHLYALRPAALPGEIKNRLIWTSDLTPSLVKKAFGGRLNVSAAINNLDQDVFRLVEGTPLIGPVRQKDNYALGVRTKDTGQALSIPFGKVRRMVKRSDGSWDAFLASSADKDAPLLRTQFYLQSIKYKDEAAGTFLQSDITVGGDISDVDIKLASQVADYISSMK